MNRIKIVAILMFVLGIIINPVAATSELPIGKEISAATSEVLIQHAADVEIYIYNCKYNHLSAEGKLDLIKKQQKMLNDSFSMMQKHREELIKMRNEGKISKEAFIVDLFRLNTLITSKMRFASALDESLTEIGKNSKLNSLSTFNTKFKQSGNREMEKNEKEMKDQMSKSHSQKQNSKAKNSKSIS